MSPPHRGADRNDQAMIDGEVALSRPLTGARIETLGCGNSTTVIPSRPLTGARIETSIAVLVSRLIFVAPSQGRGSKRASDEAMHANHCRPLTGARIETIKAQIKRLSDLVAPSQGRGSKLSAIRSVGTGIVSPPHRGADRNRACPCRSIRTMSPPHRGADRNPYWEYVHSGARESPPHRGADRNVTFAPDPITGHLVAPSQGRGSKPTDTVRIAPWHGSPPHRGADRNHALRHTYATRLASPPHRGADRNFRSSTVRDACAGRPLTGARIETARPSRKPR